MTETARVGLVGLGKIAQTHHLPNLIRQDGFEVTGLCDLSLDLAKNLADAAGLGHALVTSDVHDLLGGQVDALVVANRHHFPILAAAQEAGVPTLVEKPACWTTEQFDRLRSAASHQAPILVGYMKRLDPAVQEFLAAERADEPPLWVRAHNFAGGRHRVERLYPILKPGPFPPDTEPEDLAINAAVLPTLDGDADRAAIFRMLMELAIHDVNLLHALVGRLDMIHATAWQSSVGWAVVVSGATAAGPVFLEILPDFQNSREWDETLTVFRSSGRHELVFGSPFLHHEPTAIRREEAAGARLSTSGSTVTRRSGFEREIAHFHGVVTGEHPPLTTLADAEADLTFILEVARRAEIAR